MTEYNPSKIIKDGNTYNFRDTTKIPLSGSNQISGDLIPATTNTYNFGSPSLQWNSTYTRNILIDNDINIASSLINKTSTSGSLALRGGSTPQDGASIGLYGKDYTGALSGSIYMTAYGNSDSTSFRIYPSGAVRVTNTSTGITKNVAMQEDVIPRSGGAVLSGTLFTRVDTNSSLAIRSGPYYADGASLQLKGKDQADASGGRAYIYANNGTRNTTLSIWPTGEVIFDNALALKASADNTCSCGTSDRRWTEVYSATGTINTSDVRLKNNIKDIDNKLLDAWENVEPKQYKFNDATEKKGEKARYHTGYLAQDIQTECEKHGVNASDYGLFCYDEWEEQEEEIEEIETEKDGKIIKEKRIIQPRREKGNSYALRYEEALIVECAYLRKCIKELRNEIEELKSSK